MTTTATRPLRVDFNTSQFQFSHGKAPRGYGSWGFGLSPNPDVLGPDLLWGQGTLTQAKAQVKQQLADRGVQGFVTLWVLP